MDVAVFVLVTVHQAFTEVTMTAIAGLPWPTSTP
jgi:hypothetical protein